jgi:hypothetical protein
MRTLLLDTDLWDLCVDAAGNIAAADAPYALAQDAASACRLFAGELYYDKAPGVPYFDQILGHFPPLALMKAQYEAAAMRVPGVTAARCLLAAIKGRQLSGQVQVTDEAGNVTAAGF